jgi:hypothetical protein
MTFNPYAPPVEGPLGPAALPPAGAPQDWGASEVIGLGWERMKADWPTLIFAPMVGQMLAGIPGQIPQVLAQPAMTGDVSVVAVVIVTLIAGLLGIAAGAFVAVGVTRIYLSAARGRTANFADIFSGWDRFGHMLATQFLVGLIVIAGFICFIVPGIIAMLGLSFAQYFVVDRRMSPVEAIAASWEVTKGHKLSLFGFGFLAIGVIFIGLLACCIGVMPASATLGVATAIIYTRLSGTMGDGGGAFGGFSPPPAGAGPGAEPPGGWGMGGGGYGPPPGGGYGLPPGGGYGPPPGGGYGPPPGGGYGPPPGGGWGR